MLRQSEHMRETGRERGEEERGEMRQREKERERTKRGISRVGIKLKAVLLQERLRVRALNSRPSG